ncbi:MAG: hypothetical protein BWX61_01301 [Bacteroidetes bacterium ADurb.Bin035]|nr:MAG: hypothetical protein BWX61_01301 [Bacteroidetes bacterium ADurb.Bin035]
MERGFTLAENCLIAMAGDRPVILSTSGFIILPKNCLAYALRLSTYFLCPSAYIVSKANEVLPEPDNPVTTVIFRLGMLKVIFLRLLDLAPSINISL